MKIKMGDLAVSEIIGAIILLAIAIVAISIIYVQVLSNPGPGPETYVTIIGKLESENGNTTVAFESRRGQTLGPDTEIILTIAGQQIPPKKISDFLHLNNNWNIGEKIFPVLYLGDLSDPQIEATIVDKKSNSIVFWGRLQEGYMVPPFGRGGLWHFNESFWDGTALEVKDSSGNNNHGTAHNDANTTDDVVSTLANRSGAFNVIDYDGYVEVKDHYSLHMTENITIEAWIKPFTDTPGGTIGLLDQFGYTPYVTNVTGDKYLFAVVSEDSKHEGNLQTVDLTPHHQLSENSVIDVEYDFGEGNPNQQNMRPIITHVFGNVYAVAYNTKTESRNLSIYVKTFNISSNGTIENTGNKIFDDNESNIGEPNRPSMVKVYDFDSYSIFAITYSIYVDDSHPSVGVIKTINISHDGHINYTGEMANFDDVKGYGSCIIQVADNVFAVAYRNAFNFGVIKMFNISSDGYIEYTGKEFVFDNICYEPSFIHGEGDVFAIAYRGSSDNGILKTFDISSDGTVINTKSSKIFESADCFNPCIIHHSENYYIIVYSTAGQGSSDGYYTILEIANNGSITTISNNKVDLPQSNDRCNNPIAIKITERGFAIVFESIAGGNGHPGYLMPIDVEFPSDYYSRGIHKLGSYGIYANLNEVYANINTNTINASIVPNSWNYVVLTYDRNQMSLYVNGILKNTLALTEAISVTDSNLIFGDLFYGLIDEVAIYDRALNYTDVQNNYKRFAPIIISNVNSSNITYVFAIITWDTNVLSDSVVRYGSTIPTIEVTSPSWVTSHSVSLSDLNSHTTYYYEVQSTSQQGYTIIDNNGGRYYTFTTENNLPNIPRKPNPDNNSDKVKITITLEWIGGDEDGDPVTYNVFFGKTSTPPKVSDNQTETYYDPPGDLDNLTTYYWQIVAYDNQGAYTIGPIWNFTTKNN